MYDFGYVAATFFPEDIQELKELVEEACSSEDFYEQKGDVTHKSHLTFLYGICENELDRGELESYIKSIDLKELKIDGLILIPAHKDFQVLSLNVVDSNGRLKSIHEDLKQFPFEPTVQFETFVPHLAIAYVKPNFKLDQNKKLDIPTKLRIKEIKYFGIQG